jgi:hypothetical protein
MVVRTTSIVKLAVGSIVLIPLLIIIVFPVLLRWNSKHTDEQRRNLPILEAELSQIEIFPGDVFIDNYSGYKATHAYTGKRFSTKRRWETLSQYYNNEANRLGWIQSKAESLKEWGKDYGGHFVQFRRGSYVLSLQYSGSSPSGPDQYSVDVSSGLW